VARNETCQVAALWWQWATSKPTAMWVTFLTRTSKPTGAATLDAAAAVAHAAEAGTVAALGR